MITEQFIDTYMDGVFPTWRELKPDATADFRESVRNGLTAVYPLMVAAERERIRRNVAMCAMIWNDEVGEAVRCCHVTAANAMYGAAQHILDREIDPNTSSEAGQALGCASEGEASAPSSDNPST